MNLLAARLVDDNVCQEGDELRGRVSSGCLSQYLAGLGVVRCIQRQRAVSEVFKAVALSASRRKGQHRVLPVECLDRGLLIDTENTAACARGFRYNRMTSAAFRTVVLP